MNRRRFRKLAAIVLPVVLATLLGAVQAQDKPSPGPAEGAEAEELIEPFLGTWVYSETVQPVAEVPPHAVERHLLIRWRSGRLLVKTFDYIPSVRARGRESDWKGTIREDQWNITEQTFTLRSDGSIGVSLGGTEGIGPVALKHYWWAAGSMEILDGEDGPILHYHTDQGYAPSPKGNLWKPIERKYRLVSRDIDPKYLPGRR